MPPPVSNETPSPAQRTSDVASSTQPPPPLRAVKDAGGRGALLVGAGILLSRIVGLVRERVFAFFFGNSIPAAAFKAALRIPNFLQNLFGEGVLSGSFIPVYASLLGKGDEDAADRVAGAVFGLLSLAVSTLVLLGVLFTPFFIDTIAPGFTDADGSRPLAILLVRILFPATGFLVLSAWCLGILNSHRRFFLSYAAPVIWNVCLIGTLVAFGRHTVEVTLARYVAYAAVAGSALQFGIQLPSVISLLKRFRPSLATGDPGVRQVLRSFGPVVIGRGVVQISAYVDTAYASLISPAALAALSYAQTLYLIPVSLFGMAVSAAELPEMSRATGTSGDVSVMLRQRIDRSAARIAFFVVPSAAAFLFLGDIVGGALLQTGRFTAADTRYLWYLLMGSTVGLLAATLGRLYSSAFYALKDTRTPLLFAAIRVGLTAVLAYWSAVKLPDELGIPRHLGGVGITATTGMAAWIEFFLLRRAITQRIGGKTGVTGRRLGELWGSALVASGLGLAIKWALISWRGPNHAALREWGGHILPAPALHPVVTAALVLAPFGVAYFGFTALLGVPESLATVRRVAGRLVRK